MEGWIKENFEIESSDRVWRITQKGRTVTYSRYWHDRPYFKEGDLVMIGGFTKSAYEILGRVGTHKRPHYDVRNLEDGSILFNKAGYYFQLLTPKKDYPKFKEVEGPEYVPREIVKKRKINKR